MLRLLFDHSDDDSHDRVALHDEGEHRSLGFWSAPWTNE